ncbi:hypothetical protein HON36_04115 [Candidatus Parcubacteria bacterium]|jgi:hypothetical protein|nr:hypothetical protein [Candidatus Parcubacteria bacterium]
MSQKTPEQDTKLEREDLVDGVDVDSVTGQSKSGNQKAIYSQDDYEDSEVSWTGNESNSSPWFDG